MLTRCQALSYDACGILCVAINPGGVKTHLDAEKVGAIQDAPILGRKKVMGGYLHFSATPS